MNVVEAEWTRDRELRSRLDPLAAQLTPAGKVELAVRLLTEAALDGVRAHVRGREIEGKLVALPGRTGDEGGAESPTDAPPSIA